MLKCTKCLKQKTHANFRMLTRKPPTYSKECLLCLYDADKLGDKTADRQMRRELEAEQEYQRELARRQIVRRRLVHFIARFQPKYLVGWAHQLICDKLERFLEAVERGESPRLMIFAPPRHGKSTIVSHYLPAWALGHHPEWEFIACSYNLDLPVGFSRKTRDLIRDKAYFNLFPRTQVDRDNQNVEGWSTTAGGGYRPAGVGGGITGKGAHVLLIDDPFKDAEEADSETMRDKVWDWYGSTAVSRLAPGGGMIIINTRWHDADLSGQALTHDKMLADEGVPIEERDNWDVLSLPAIATEDEYVTTDKRLVYVPVEGAQLIRKKGEALHPERYNLSRLMRIKRGLQPRHWSALYQQNPVPDEGEFFKRSDFRYYDPQQSFDGMYTMVAWDTAVKLQDQNAYTVGLIGAVDWQGQIYLRGMVRARLGTFEICDAIINTQTRYEPELQGIEKTMQESAIAPVLDREMRRRRVHINFCPDLKPIQDKVMRARPAQGKTQQGYVLLPMNQPWVEVFINECLRFPNGQFVDCVDAFAWLVRMVAKSALPRAPTKRKAQKSWKDKLPALVREQQGKSKAPMAA